MQMLAIPVVSFLILLRSSTVNYVANYAVGDGATDDTDAIQAAINETSPYSTLLFPTGHVYYITRPLYTKDNIKIDVEGGTVAGGVVDNYRPVIYNANSLSLLKIIGTNISIRNLRFAYNFSTNNSIASSMASFAADVKDILIENCVFRVMLSDPVDDFHKLPQAFSIGKPRNSNIRICNNKIYSANYGILIGNWGFSSEELVVYSNHLSYLYFENNEVVGDYGDAVAVNTPIFGSPGSGIPGFAAHDIYIRNNSLSCPYSERPNAGFGVSIAGAHHVEISSNTIFNCKWQGVHVEDRAWEVHITDNEITDVLGGNPTNVWARGRDGIFLINTRGVDVINNLIMDVPHRGIELPYETATYNLKTVISGNRIDGTGLEPVGNSLGEGIFVGGPAGTNLNASVDNNIVDNTYSIPIKIHADGVVCTNNYDSDNISIIPVVD